MTKPDKQKNTPTQEEQSPQPPTLPEQNQPADNPIKQSILLRASVFHLALWSLAIWAIIVVIWLQFGPESQKLKAQASEYSFKNEILEATRGDILSDDYRTLATSIVYYDLRMDLGTTGLTDEMFNENIKELSQKLAGFFKDKSQDQYMADITQARRSKKRYYRLSNKKIDYLQLQRLKTFPLLNEPPNIGGFIPQEIGRRVHPYGNLAARVIGFVNRNGVKVGIEGSFNDNLKGTDGVTVKQKISGNFWIPVASPYNIEPINGIDVVSTINIEIQDIAQRELTKRILETEADWGTVVVMDVKTGAVKAIANATLSKKDGKIIEDYNYAIGMSLEPGSTFKLAGFIALLDDVKAPLDQIINTGSGTEQIGYVKVVDSRSIGYGIQTLGGVFEHSSNIGMAKAVNKYYGSNPARFVEYMSKLGLNKPFGLQIAGEAAPLIKHPKLNNGWDGTTLTMMSYGYALRITPIHTVALYNAIANAGRMVKPMFVTELREQGKTVKKFPPQTVIESVCSPSTLRDVRYSLEGVVERGTAKMLKNDRYTVAAKTGTAQIAMGRGGYSTGSGAKHYLGSVAGYFPAENPRYTMIVALKTFYPPGSDKTYYGGALAGPLFRTIADQIFSADFELHKPQITPATGQNVRLSSKAGNAEALNQLITTLGLPYGKVHSTMAIIDSGRAVSYLPHMDSTGMPDVKGMALSDALKLLYSKGFYKVQVNGKGKIINQSIAYDSVTGIKQAVLNLK